MKFVNFLGFILLLASFANQANAQQFAESPGAFAAGVAVSSEGVEVFDANGDGWLDVLFTNGVGLTIAQGALAPQLFINQCTVGQAVFVDESLTRLPVGFVQQGKALTIADVDGDGDDDIIFANGFLTLPNILINDGTGIFSDETATRFPNINLNAAGVGAGDLDGDGDIDLVFTDAGAPFFGPGAPPKLFINDGFGVFSNEPAKMNGVSAAGAWQVNLVDIDNDFDLDVIVDASFALTRAYLNDGNANFSLSSSALFGSSGSYESDWADLDNDGDLDGAAISIAGFEEGVITNNSSFGSLDFVSSTDLIAGVNGNNDGEVAYLDADNDGVLDLLICSQSFVQEKLFLNAGTMAPGSFVQQIDAFATTADFSHDMALGDFDNDGDIDVATAQGTAGNLTNRLYLNAGPVDTLGPKILRVEQLNSLVGQQALAVGVNVHSHLQDSSYDNGRIFISATLTGTVTKGAFVQPFSFPMSHIGGGLFRGTLQNLPTPPSGSLESQVTYQILAIDRQSNSSLSNPSMFTICGSSNYGPDAGVNDMSLSLSNEAITGSLTTVLLGQGPSSAAGVLVAAPNADSFPALGGTVLVDISAPIVFSLTTGATGSASFPIFLPATPQFTGAALSLQAFMPDASKPFGFAMSEGLRVVICGEVPVTPTLATVSPRVFALGTQVTVTGLDFSIGMTVIVDGMTYSASNITPTSATFFPTVTPACDSSLTIVNQGNLTSSAVIVNSTPMINVPLSTPSGTAAGNAIYLISGSGFGPGTTVTIGGNPCFILSAFFGVVVTRTPAGAVGPAIVVITNAAGCVATTNYNYF